MLLDPSGERCQIAALVGEAASVARFSGFCGVGEAQQFKTKSHPPLMIREINSADWPAFCKRITEKLAGSITTLEITKPDGTKTNSAGNSTLHSMVLDTSNDCNDVIALRLANAHEALFEIIEPIRILLHASKTSQDFNPIQIEAESGIAVLTFHPAIHPQMLEGLKVS
jgi:hypothetical protein